MQGWSRNVTESTHNELRRVRRELRRWGATPLRVIIAGDPTKPVLTFTVARWVPLAVLVAGVLSIGVDVLFRGHAEPAISSVASAGIYRTAAAIRTEADLESDRARFGEETGRPSSGPDTEPPPKEPERPARAAVEPEDTDSPSSAQDGVKFTVDVLNTGKSVHVNLVGPAREPDEPSYRRLRHELRCQRTGAEYPIDPRLIELLYQISAQASQRVQVISAYRAPVHYTDLNYHARGMAADIRIPGRSTSEVRDLAQSLGAHGVGYYPTVQFVHIDVRDVPFSWTDTSGHGDQLPRYESDMMEPTAAISTSAPSALPSFATPEPSSSAWLTTVLPIRADPSLPPRIAAGAAPSLPLDTARPNTGSTTPSAAPAAPAPQRPQADPNPK